LIKSLELQEQWIDVFETDLTTLLYKEIIDSSNEPWEHFSDDKYIVDNATDALQEMFLDLKCRVTGIKGRLKYNDYDALASLLVAFLHSQEGVVDIKDMIRIMFLDKTTILIFSNDNGG